MHGRVKTRTTEEQQELKRKEREKRVKLYKAGIAKTFDKRETKVYDEEAFEISGQLLAANPDIYSLWNFRREMILFTKEKSAGDTNDYQVLMDNELHLTLQCLKTNPKSYSAWHHRTWILLNMPTEKWAQELAICNKYLEMDERNFHVWDHRRFVVNQSKVPPKDELDYSTSKIATNFSNYSSWHYRSHLLPLIFPDPEHKLPIKEDEHKRELELVQNACFTDPNDSSAWFYQRWLLGRSIQPQRFAQVIVTSEFISAALAQYVCSLNNTFNIKLTIDGKEMKGRWACTSELSHVWRFNLGQELIQADFSVVVVTLLKCDQEIDSLTVEVVQGEGFGHRKAHFDAGFSKGLTTVLEEQLDSCHQLLDMEPDSKWTLLTSMLLMQAIDRSKYEEETINKLVQLIQVDPLRTGYYNDLRSRYVVEYAINALDKTISTSDKQQEIDLSNQNLTGLYHSHYLGYLLKVDLANNMLFRSLGHLHPLQKCTWLCLEKNSIENLHDIPELQSLQTLLLRGNNLKTLHDISNIKRCSNLVSVDFLENPVADDALLESTIREFLPNIQMLNKKTM